MAACRLFALSARRPLRSLNAGSVQVSSKRNGKPEKSWVEQLTARPRAASRTCQAAKPDCARLAAEYQNPLQAAASATTRASGSTIGQRRGRLASGWNLGSLTASQSRSCVMPVRLSEGRAGCHVSSFPFMPFDPSEQPQDDLWVFAYGSLMWRPGFAHAE